MPQSKPLMGGGGLPTNIVVSGVSNEDNARIYEYLKSLRAEQTATLRGITYDGDIIAIYGTKGEGYALYSDGRCSSSNSGD